MRMLCGHSPDLDPYLSDHPTNAKLRSSFQTSSKIFWVGETTDRCRQMQNIASLCFELHELF